MAKNSNGKQVAQSGPTKAMPKNHGGKQTSVYYKNHGGKQTTVYYESKQGAQSSYNQTTSKTSYVDKQTGSYARVTNKEVVSTGDTFKEKSTGRVGYKDEYKTTSTYKVGDKSGYTEYQVEERFRNVNYGGSKNTGGNKCGGGSKYYLE